MLAEERKAIANALSGFEDDGFIRVKERANAGIDDLFEQFNRFRDQVAIFHYAGHADGTALQLEKPGGGNEAAKAGGLAQMLGMSEGLKLVFLNGCATKDQVRVLIENGVPAVIATAAPVDDGLATKFANEFYRALAVKKSIGDAFKSAKNLIETQPGDTRVVKEFRAMHWGGESEAAIDPADTWGIYTHPNHESVLSWVLPRQAETNVIIRGAAQKQAAGVAVNTELIERLSNAVAPFSTQLKIMMMVAKEENKPPEIRIVRQMVMDAFPVPVGHQLRRLFSNTNVDEARLRQLVATYETTTKMMAFIMLSQLWNARLEKADLNIPDEQAAILSRFLAIDAGSEETFDYLAVVLAVNHVLVTNDIEPFLAECADLEEALHDAESRAAHSFMNEMRSELAAGAPPAGEIESFCVQAETHLAEILCDMAFIVQYKFATIKGIDILQTRHRPPQFRHLQVMLDKVTAGFADEPRIRTTFTDNDSVILMKDLDDVSEYLNISPFIIDQNALTGNENSKLFFFRYYDADARAVHYHSVGDTPDKLVIADAMEGDDPALYMSVRELVEEFRTELSK
nr:CHAT domain-containing protein [Pacificimonas pallii]